MPRSEIRNATRPGARLERPASIRPEPIAIVGAACRFPGAPDLDAYWSLLSEGRDAVSTLPADRFNQDWFHHPRPGEPGRSYTFAAGHLDDVSGFDSGHFGLSPREAAEADPQQRVLLEVASEAFEDAGWPATSIAGREIGVFIGGSSTDYAELRLSDPSGADRYFMTGNTLSILANRITNVFDLRGPAQTIDTACSSSLVALSLAVDALRAGRAEAAVVGGVQLLLSPYGFMGFSRASMLSPTGRCRVFSAGADGYVRAEGAGAVILKPLGTALADGDSIRGVILAAGVNSVGRSIGLSLPNPHAQARLIGSVLAEAGLPARRVTYFEAHGTGTQAGDPAEAWAIGKALATVQDAEGSRAAPLPVGSAKTNIGHLETASGMAGLIKALLMLEKRVVPPSLHFTDPNPKIDFASLNIRVPVTAEPLRGLGRAAPVIGVNSFGFGGTNASLLLPPRPPRSGSRMRMGPCPPCCYPPARPRRCRHWPRPGPMRFAPRPSGPLPCCAAWRATGTLPLTASCCVGQMRNPWPSSSTASSRARKARASRASSRVPRPAQPVAWPSPFPAMAPNSRAWRGRRWRIPAASAKGWRRSMPTSPRCSAGRSPHGWPMG
jgi:acyl transferase domain-containing protein